MSIQPLERGLSVIAQLAAGDSAAAEQFERLFRPQLLGFVIGRGVPLQEAEDIVQDVLLTGIQQACNGDFRGQSSLGTWLIAILKNKIADYWRAAAVRAAQEVSGEDHVEAPRNGPLNNASLDAQLDVQRILNSLPKLHRAILLLNVTESYTTEEIAAILKMKPGTVGRKLAEAKHMLRAALTDRSTPLKLLSHPKKQTLERD